APAFFGSRWSRQLMKRGTSYCGGGSELDLACYWKSGPQVGPWVWSSSGRTRYREACRETIPREVHHDCFQGRILCREPCEGFDQPEARPGAGGPCAGRVADDGDPLRGPPALQLRLRRRLPAVRACAQGT